MDILLTKQVGISATSYMIEDAKMNIDDMI